MSGALDLDSREFRTNPWPIYAHLRASDPVHWTARKGCCLLTRYRDVRRALISPEFSVEHPFRASRQVFGPTVMDVEGPVHDDWRAILAAELTPGRIDDLSRELVEPVVRRHVDALLAKGRVDFVAEFAAPLVTEIAARLVGIADAEPHALFATIAAMMRYLDRQHGGLQSAAEAQARVESDVRQRLQRPELLPASSLLSAMARAVQRRPELGVQLVSRHAVFVLASAVQTTVNAICNMLLCLLRNPHIIDHARANVALLPAIVRESLRFEPVVHMVPRFTRADVEFDRVRIERGSLVQLSLASANRDEERFVDAERWDPYRPATADLAFGSGRHSCLGARLAQAEMEVVLRELLQAVQRFEPQTAELPLVEGFVIRGPRALPLRVVPRR